MEFFSGGERPGRRKNLLMCFFFCWFFGDNVNVFFSAGFWMAMLWRDSFSFCVVALMFSVVFKCVLLR